MFPEYISESDKREAWNNLIAFMEADKFAKSRMANSPLARSSITLTHTGINSPAGDTSSRQASFSANKRRVK